MKLIFIRHAEPYYPTDSLTEKGEREARLLAERTRHWSVSQIYCSPLGRAQKTALPTLEAKGLILSHTFPDAPKDGVPDPDPAKALVVPWLREFSVGVDPAQHPIGQTISWDFTPAFLAENPMLYDRDSWWTAPIFASEPVRGLPRSVAQDEKAMAMYQALYGRFWEPQEGVPAVRQEYDWCTGRLDEVLAGWGYVRDGLLYRHIPPLSEPSDAWMSHEGRTCEDTLLRAAATRSGKDSPLDVAEGKSPAQALLPYAEEEPVLVFFCHLGIMGVLISHLIHVAPAVLHHSFLSAPSSVTVICTDERVPGEVQFRIQAMGDTAHLREAAEPVSYYGAFSGVFQL